MSSVADSVTDIVPPDEISCPVATNFLLNQAAWKRKPAEILSVIRYAGSKVPVSSN